MANIIDNIKKAELTEAVKRYYTVNEVKKEAAAEVKELGDEIKDLMAETEVAEFAVEGLVATLTARTSKSLDTDALLTWIAKKGLRIPDNCYVTKVSPVLSVKPDKKAARKVA